MFFLHSKNTQGNFDSKNNKIIATNQSNSKLNFMKRSFSVFILSAFFVYSIIATSRNPDLMPPRPTQPFPQIASVSSENLVLPLVSVTISEAK
jgi:hypothetical protein